MRGLHVHLAALSRDEDLVAAPARQQHPARLALAQVVAYHVQVPVPRDAVRLVAEQARLPPLLLLLLALVVFGRRGLRAAAIELVQMFPSFLIPGGRPRRVRIVGRLLLPRVVAETGQHGLLQQVPRSVTPDSRNVESVDLELRADGVERGDVGAVKVLNEAVGEEVAEEGGHLARRKTGHDDERVGERRDVRSGENDDSELACRKGNRQKCSPTDRGDNLRKADMAASRILLVWKSPSLHRRVALSSSGVDDR